MLLDTSGLLCMMSVAAPQHRAALGEYARARSRLTHNLVLAEFVALAQARRLPRRPVLDCVDRLLIDSAVTIVYIDPPCQSTALGMLRRRADKGWSLCDAVSFVLMEERGEWEALTLDHHFEQAGFVRLLPP